MVDFAADKGFDLGDLAEFSIVSPVQENSPVSVPAEKTVGALKSWTAKYNLRRFGIICTVHINVLTVIHFMFIVLFLKISFCEGIFLVRINLSLEVLCKFLINPCSHFDSVRALVWADSEFSLLSASEDHTIKLWHLPQGVKK